MAVSMKAARVNAGLTQAQAAKHLGISKNTLAGYENGRVIPQVHIAKRMAVVYGLSIDDIIFLPSDCA